MEIKYPELKKWLKGLRKFQRNTIYHTIRHILKNQRFLVADEVGLGKTKIARGVIAYFLSRLKERETPARVVYLCANQQLAWQNIQSFHFFNDTKGDEENCRSDLRLGLLCWRLGIDQQYDQAKRLQLWALTPGTSFEIQCGSGNMEERAVITGIIDPGLKNEKFQQIMESFSAFKGKVSDTWTNRWLPEIELQQNVLADIRVKVANYFENSDELDKFFEYYCPSESKDLDCFEKLAAIFIGYDEIKNKKSDLYKDPDYPGAPLSFMRKVLAVIGIRELKPDLVIMDEFQRYDRLLFQEDADSERSLFADLLKVCSSDENTNKAHFLLLSATPYSTYANAAEDWGCSLNPHEGFIKLMTWLAHGEDKLSDLLQNYAQSFSNGNITELESNKKRLEKTLLTLMCRTERKDFYSGESAFSFPDSLWKNKTDAIKLAAEELLRYQRTYQTLQGTGTFQQWHELLNYAKYGTRPLSFMQDYVLSEKADKNKNALSTLYYSNKNELKDCNDSRIQETLKHLGKLKDLLWLPPSNPRRPLAGDFEGLEKEGLSKILFFSSWRFIPRMISLILSAKMPKKDFSGEPPENSVDSLCKLCDGQSAWHPAKALYAAINRYYGNSIKDRRKKDIVNAFIPEFGARIFCRNSYEDPVRFDFRNRGFTQSMIKYCHDGCLEDVFDEYIYMIFMQARGDAAVLEQYLSKKYLRLPSHLNVELSQDTISLEKYMSDCFGEKDVKRNDSQNQSDIDAAGSMTHLQRAFNSPFAPFILSTTSIGQEGLDFHWYCRKIIHWNIPDNPIEFEQRNGRINRYHSLSVRQSVVKDSDKEKSWEDIFLAAETAYKDESGIQPHWFIAEPRYPIEQFAFYLPGSQDEECLRRVCMQLGIYRVALGQPHQEDFLKRLEHIDDLKKYALCLQPSRK